MLVTLRAPNATLALSRSALEFAARAGAESAPALAAALAPPPQRPGTPGTAATGGAAAATGGGGGGQACVLACIRLRCQLLDGAGPSQGGGGGAPAPPLAPSPGGVAAASGVGAAPGLAPPPSAPALRPAFELALAQVRRNRGELVVGSCVFGVRLCFLLFRFSGSCVFGSCVFGSVP